MAQRMRQNIRQGDIAARVGGDEFLILPSARATPCLKSAGVPLTVIHKVFKSHRGISLCRKTGGVRGGCSTARPKPSIPR